MSARICVTGNRASIPGLFVTILLGTTIVSPGSIFVFPTKIFLLTFSVMPLAFII